jgi:hypothetical protein
VLSGTGAGAPFTIYLMTTGGPPTGCQQTHWLLHFTRTNEFCALNLPGS